MIAGDDQILGAGGGFTQQLFFVFILKRDLGREAGFHLRVLFTRQGDTVLGQKLLDTSRFTRRVEDFLQSPGLCAKILTQCGPVVQEETFTSGLMGTPRLLNLTILAHGLRLRRAFTILPLGILSGCLATAFLGRARFIGGWTTTWYFFHVIKF
jgi:hypothetical protein